MKETTRIPLIIGLLNVSYSFVDDGERLWYMFSEEAATALEADSGR